MNITSIFKDKTFNVEISQIPKKAATNNKPLIIPSESNKEPLNEYAYWGKYLKMITVCDQNDDNYNLKEYFFKGYKIGCTYIDKFENLYKVVEKSENSISVIRNIYLNKYKNDVITLTEKQWMEKMDNLPAWQKQVY